MVKLNVNIIDVLGELEIGVSGKEDGVPDQLTPVEKAGLESIKCVIKSKFKVIATSNYDDETMNDNIVCIVESERYGSIIVDALNKLHPDGQRFYKLKPSSYKLYEWEQT